MMDTNNQVSGNPAAREIRQGRAWALRAYWERRLTGSACSLGAPAFQPASPDAGSMPASGDRAARATWYVSFRMFSSDGFGSGLKGFRDFLRLWHGIEPCQSRAG